MTRKISLALLLCVLLAVLSGCVSEELTFSTQAPPGYGASTPTIEPVVEPQDEGTYEGDPLGEEDIGDTDMGAPQEIASVGTYAYAGSTPLPLDPIDMPTPTPRPELTFSYETYEVTKLGVKFDGPSGWIRDDSANDTFTLTEPSPRDNYTAFITIRKAPVSKEYNLNDLANEAKAMLESIGAANYIQSTRKPSLTATRSLMEHDGVYANYEGTLVDGTRVRGRVHVTCIDKTLYSVHLSHAAGYNTDYLQNHGKLRSTLTLTK